MDQTYSFCPKCQSTMQLKEDGYNHCVSSDCAFVQYQNPTPVVAAVIEYGDKQVLLGHNRAWPQQWFGLITGFLERHEHPDECVLREVKEEVGLDGTIESFIGHYTFKRMNQVILAYHVKAEGDIILDDELDEVKIVPFDKVKTWPAGTGKALNDFLTNLGYEVEEVLFSKA